MAPTSVLTILTVPKLKERCRELGIPVGGKKADLIARIEGKLSETGAATVTAPPTSSSQGGGAHTLSNNAAQRTGKRKAPIKNPSHTSGEKGSDSKRTKPSRATGVAASAPIPTQPPLPPVCDLLRKSPITKVQENTHKGRVAKQPTLVRNLEEILPTVSTPTTFISADGATNSTTDLSTNPPVLSQDLLLLQASSQVTEQLRVSPSQPRNSHKNSRQGDLDVAFLNPKQTGTRNSSGQRIYLGEKNSLIPAKQRKDGITSVPGNIAGRGASTGGTEFANPDKPRSGLAIPSPLVQVGGARMGNNANGMMASQGDDRERDQSVSGGITIPITESPNPSPGLSPAQYPRALGTVKAEVKRFKGLVPNKKSKSCIPGGYAYTDADTEHEGDATATSSTDTTEPLPKVSSNPLPRKQDYEISASIIRNPPPHLLRRQVEKITQVLALTAFYGFSINSSTSVPGDFLKYFAGLSRNYRYASTLAFTHLIRLEFPGKRTTHWLRTKRIDEGVADVRAWYWHRVSERKTAIEQVRTSWMERVWRFLVLASVPAGSSQAMDIGPGRLGLWFSGISQHLLADPDLHGQFETAVRFWIRRFYVWVTRNGGGYPLLLEDLRGEIVQKIQPVDEKGNRELWRVETRCGGVYFIVGMTGEVVGWVEADGTVGDGLESVRQRRAKTRMGTTIRTRTGARTIGGAGSLQGNRRNQVNTDNITWQNLREDWREHASALVLSSSSPNETGAPPKRLLESVYRPGSKTISHGIHESVKLPHHRALAERWILAQVEPGGISGKPTLEALHGHARRKQKVVLDLQAKLMVESVRCAGEKWTSSMEGTLAQGLGFVQTPGMGWFVLEETGQNIAQEEYGIQGLWATVLGVDEKGILLNSGDLEELEQMFVWKDMLD